MRSSLSTAVGTYTGFFLNGIESGGGGASVALIPHESPLRRNPRVSVAAQRRLALEAVNDDTIDMGIERRNRGKQNVVETEHVHFLCGGTRFMYSFNKLTSRDDPNPMGRVGYGCDF